MCAVAAATDDRTLGLMGSTRVVTHHPDPQGQEALASGGGTTSSVRFSMSCRTGGHGAVVEGRFSVARRRLIRLARRRVLAWSAVLYNSSSSAEAMRYEA